MKQEKLNFIESLESGQVATSDSREHLRMDLNKHIKDLQQLTRVLKKLSAPKKPLSGDHLVKAFREAIAAGRSLGLSELISSLERETQEFMGRMQAGLEQRRESLLAAARLAEISHKRFGEYDRVGPFKVSYKGKKVQLELGSEVAREFEETDGPRIFEVIQKEAASCDSEPFARELFFRTIKDALRLARSHGQDRDGWVPVRTVFTYVALLRNLSFEEFVKKPGRRTFREYSTAQFVYDLARFGRGGWSLGDEALRAMTPNMATVAAKKAMTLPDLDSVETLGPQFAVLRIEKKERLDGTERNPSEAR